MCIFIFEILNKTNLRHFLPVDLFTADPRRSPPTTADHPKMYENTCFISISFAFIGFLCVFLSSILVFFCYLYFFSYFLYIIHCTCPKALTQSAVFQYAFHIKSQFSKKNRSYIWMDFYKLKKNRDKIMKK